MKSGGDTKEQKRLHRQSKKNASRKRLKLMRERAVSVMNGQIVVTHPKSSHHSAIFYSQLTAKVFNSGDFNLLLSSYSTFYRRDFQSVFGYRLKDSKDESSLFDSILERRGHYSNFIKSFDSNVALYKETSHLTTVIAQAWDFIVSIPDLVYSVRDTPRYLPFPSFPSKPDLLDGAALVVYHFQIDGSVIHVPVDDVASTAESFLASDQQQDYQQPKKLKLSLETEAKIDANVMKNKTSSISTKLTANEGTPKADLSVNKLNNSGAVEDMGALDFTEISLPAICYASSGISLLSAVASSMSEMSDRSKSSTEDDESGYKGIDYKDHPGATDSLDATDVIIEVQKMSRNMLHLAPNYCAVEINDDASALSSSSGHDTDNLVRLSPPGSFSILRSVAASTASSSSKSLRMNKMSKAIKISNSLESDPLQLSSGLPTEENSSTSSNAPNSDSSLFLGKSRKIVMNGTVVMLIDNNGLIGRCDTFVDVNSPTNSNLDSNDKF